MHKVFIYILTVGLLTACQKPLENTNSVRDENKTISIATAVEPVNIPITENSYNKSKLRIDSSDQCVYFENDNKELFLPVLVGSYVEDNVLSQVLTKNKDQDIFWIDVSQNSEFNNGKFDQSDRRWISRAPQNTCKKTKKIKLITTISKKNINKNNIVEFESLVPPQNKTQYTSSKTDSDKQIFLPIYNYAFNPRFHEQGKLLVENQCLYFIDSQNEKVMPIFMSVNTSWDSRINKLRIADNQIELNQPYSFRVAGSNNVIIKQRFDDINQIINFPKNKCMIDKVRYIYGVDEK